MGVGGSRLRFEGLNGGWQRPRKWAVGPGVLVDAVPAPGGDAPGLSVVGIASWIGGLITRCTLVVPFLFVVSPTILILCM